VAPLHLDRWIDFSAICFSMLVHVIVAEIRDELADALLLLS
jgi:hypothetical protein